MSGTSSGFTGMKVGGVAIAGTIENKALADACEKAIIRAVEVLVDQKKNIPIPEAIKPKEIKNFNASNCNVLKSGKGPSVMVFIPEVLTYGNSAVANTGKIDNISREERDFQERQENRQLLRDIFGASRNASSNAIPGSNTVNKTNAVYRKVEVQESTTENEIMKSFIEAGFKVIDPKVFKSLIDESTIGGDSPDQLIALGKKMGANIIITGMAMAERIGVQANMNTFRGRLELRALTTNDATVLATNSMESGGIDVSETAASKIALKNVGKQMANYLLENICEKNIQFEKLATAGASTTVKIKNINFGQLTTIYNLLKANKKVVEVKRSLNGGIGQLEILHDLDIDKIAEILSSPSTGLEITGMTENIIEAEKK